MDLAKALEIVNAKCDVELHTLKRTYYDACQRKFGERAARGVLMSGGNAHRRQRRIQSNPCRKRRAVSSPVRGGTSGDRHQRLQSAGGRTAGAFPRET